MKRLSLQFLAILRLLRPKQWLKLGFIWLGFFYTGSAALNAIPALVLTSIAFAIAAGAVYTLNDLQDLSQDRLHPKKRLRPLASGMISARLATILIVLFWLMALSLAMLISWPLAIILCVYGLLNTAYSYHLKHEVIIDVFIISSGFVLRILAGTWGVGILPSSWLLLTGSALALLLGFGKRYTEKLVLGEQANKHRGVLAEYSEDFLRSALMLCAICSLLFYSLYTASPQTQLLHGPWLMLTIPFVLFGILRYLYLVFQQQATDDPSGLVFSDRQMAITVFLWLVQSSIILAIS